MGGEGKRGPDDDVWRAECNSLTEVRRQIDALDDQIAPLLCRRLFFVQQAAKFKSSKDAVVVPSRVGEIIRRVRAVAEAYKINPAVLEHVYRTIIDDFTLEEKRRWDDLHK
jgi:isochorismate pyruvate lyase